MAQVNISEAARLTGKSRTTIYRKVKSGKVSIQEGLIDTSELIRVFGELLPDSEQVSTSTPSTKRVTTEQVTVQQQVQLEVLQEKLVSAHKEITLKDELNESLRDQIKLLDYKTEKQSVASNDHKDGFLAKFGRFLIDL